MRQIINFNANWQFSKDNKNFINIDLPHTWNNIDGTDGKNDYLRAKCTYLKEFSVELNDDEEAYLEFNGANQVCEVYLNDNFLGSHENGYSKFRVNITNHLKVNNLLKVYVSNELSGKVYPQQADFTFYGGIYRDVNLVIVKKSHFAMNYFGSNGIKVTPKIVDNKAVVNVEAYYENCNNMVATFKIDNLVKEVKVENNYTNISFEITNPHLWNGIKDPFLYKLKAFVDNDYLEVDFGIREFRIDPNLGFFLNNEKYLLRGVSRHQDREGVGSALSKENHEEDLKIILEMGVTSIRLAHYQHDEYFYSLCDKLGIVVWAEIPYISEHLKFGNDNTKLQMTELVVQNYNHPSIICWGLSNEICISNDENEERLNNHYELNELCHKLDKTRYTVMAHIGAFDFDTNKLFKVPDIHGTNIYYGWYEKKVEDVKDYFDLRHQKHPNACLAISEYGADCNSKYCNLNPERGDYSENYQAYYHEEMLKIIEDRPYLWASYVWNMFDFGSDNRSEGGKPGQNQKGLVTFDRKYKKDAYYLYKVHWNEEKMIHICNKNYVYRNEDKTRIVVYSNLDSLSLYIDDKLVETKSGMYKYVFEFEINSKHKILVTDGKLSDETYIEKVSEKYKDYQLDNKTIINWLSFADFENEDYFSLNDSVSTILANKEAKTLMLESLKRFNVTEEYLKSDNPRSPGTTLELIPVKFILRMCKDLTSDEFNGFATKLMKIKKN